MVSVGSHQFSPLSESSSSLVMPSTNRKSFLFSLKA
jgi:hypothetical protein